MPITSKLLAAFLIFAAMGCHKPKPGDPPHSKVGVAVAPPPGQTVNYDPSVIGLGAAIGTTVYDSQGVILWLKYGAPLTSWRAVPVSPLVTGDPSQAPGLKAPIGFTVTMNDGSASWVKKTASDTGWVVNPVAGGGTPDGGYMLASLAPQAASTVVGVPADAGTVPPSALTPTQLTALIKPANPDAGGALAAADFAKLATLPTGNGITIMTIPVGPIDLTVTGVYQIIPATPKRFARISTAFEVKTKSGTVSVGPTTSIGANSSNFDNLYASTVQTGFPAAVVETNLGPLGGNSNFVDLTTSGLRLNVTSGATGSSPVLTATLIMTGFLAPP